MCLAILWVLSVSLDLAIISVDKVLRTLFGSGAGGASVPGAELSESVLSPGDRQHAGALMRVNHVGEVCAQALYHGQALVCHDPVIRASLDRAAGEEVDHLVWTARRVAELGSRVSYLNPLWYSGAFVIGFLAGKCGDHWSLGFLAETERQVGAHLDGHLRSLPEADAKSRAIVRRMRDDEIAHADMAAALGGRPLPQSACGLMRFAAKVMTRTAYRI